jgi:hypothetical protein
MGISEANETESLHNETANALGGKGNLFSPFGGFGEHPVSGLDYNNFVQIRDQYSMQDVELNVRRRLPMVPERLATSILFGVRYMTLPEEFDYLTTSAVPAPGGALNQIHISTENQMIGPQIGALLEFYVENRWWVNFEMKGAVLCDRASQASVYHNVDNVGTASDFLSDRKQSHTSFVGDLALTMVYRWSPHFSTRLGYQALWISQIATGPGNLPSDITVLTAGPAQLNHCTNVAFHGPAAGLTFAW